MPYAPVILWPNAKGYIQPMASLAAIQPEWRAPLDAIVAACRNMCGTGFHSLYIRGSVALGQARNRVSDIDVILLSQRSHSPLDTAWQDRLNDEITKAWPFVHSVEILLFPLSALSESSSLCALLKTQSVCYAGDDILRCLRPQSLGFDLLFESWSLPNDIALARQLQKTEKAEKARTWAAKKIVRSGFELVMCEAGCYTRDLSACRAGFSRHHPRQAPMMDAAFAFAIDRKSGEGGFAELANFGTNWLYPEICRTYGAEFVTHSLEC